jgi:NAD(P)-dependent dehydrogenase (short-subunit alcohol dehydrogenase family)
VQPAAKVPVESVSFQYATTDHLAIDADVAAMSTTHPLDLFRVDGEVAIVTGASSGLGARFARVLHNAGARVVLAARRADRLAALSTQLNGSWAVPCDVTSPPQREALVNAAIERFGCIDILVNNAGISHGGNAEDEALEDFHRVMDVNVNALFGLSVLVASHMLDRGKGVIVNIASIAGLVATAPVKQAGYVTSKGAVIALTRELAAQWARRGIRVNALAPGWFPSEMSAELFANDEVSTWIRRNTPLGRIGREHELDGALLFLVSEASSYVTGHILVVDGGWTAR